MHTINVNEKGWTCSCGERETAPSSTDARDGADIHARANTPSVIQKEKA